MHEYWTEISVLSAPEAESVRLLRPVLEEGHTVRPRARGIMIGPFKALDIRGQRDADNETIVPKNTDGESRTLCCGALTITVAIAATRG